MSPEKELRNEVRMTGRAHAADHDGLLDLLGGEPSMTASRRSVDGFLLLHTSPEDCSADGTWFMELYAMYCFAAVQAGDIPASPFWFSKLVQRTQEMRQYFVENATTKRGGRRVFCSVTSELLERSHGFVLRALPASNRKGWAGPMQIYTFALRELARKKGLSISGQVPALGVTLDVGPIEATPVPMTWCSACDGAGVDEGTQKKCRVCGGAGEIPA